METSVDPDLVSSSIWQKCSCGTVLTAGLTFVAVLILSLGVTALAHPTGYSYPDWLSETVTWLSENLDDWGVGLMTGIAGLVAGVSLWCLFRSRESALETGDDGEWDVSSTPFPDMYSKWTDNQKLQAFLRLHNAKKATNAFSDKEYEINPSGENFNVLISEKSDEHCMSVMYLSAEELGELKVLLQDFKLITR